jgi:hypothetical protein
MSDNQLYARIWGVSGMVIVSLVASCTYGSHDKRDKWEKAVANGADPMVTACALFNQETVEQTACLLMAQNRK